MDNDEVERVAEVIAETVGSNVFKPLHDTTEDQRLRDRFRDLAQEAIALTL